MRYNTQMSVTNKFFQATQEERELIKIAKSFIKQSIALKSAPSTKIKRTKTNTHLWLLRDVTLYLYFAVFAKVNSSGLAGRLRATHVLPVPRGRAEDQTVTDCLLDRGTK